jgi:hypothetical protein
MEGGGGGVEGAGTKRQRFLRAASADDARSDVSASSSVHSIPEPPTSAPWRRANPLAGGGAARPARASADLTAVAEVAGASSLGFEESCLGALESPLAVVVLWAHEAQRLAPMAAQHAAAEAASPAPADARGSAKRSPAAAAVAVETSGPPPSPSMTLSKEQCFGAFLECLDVALRHTKVVSAVSGVEHRHHSLFLIFSDISSSLQSSQAPGARDQAHCH